DVIDDEALEDRHHLGRRLARAIDRLRSPRTQRAVQIHFGEAEVVVREPPQPRERVGGGYPAGGDVVEEPLQAIAIHWSAASTADSPSRSGSPRGRRRRRRSPARGSGRRSPRAARPPRAAPSRRARSPVAPAGRGGARETAGSRAL